MHGAWRGFVYLDFSEKKRMHTWVPYCWAHRKFRVKHGGQLELQRGTGLPQAEIRLWGKKGTLQGLGASGPLGLELKC